MYNREVKPFVKWAGGKTRIINFIDTIFPKKMKNGEIDKFIEPFVGGGAVFFHVASKYEINEFIINDNNFSLMTAYKTIKKDVDHLINNLSKIKEEYIDGTYWVSVYISKVAEEEGFLYLWWRISQDIKVQYLIDI